MTTRFDRTHSSSPGANRNAEVVLGAPGGEHRNVIYMISWSYDTTPTTGHLMVRDRSATVFELDITRSGPGFIPFPIGCEGDPGAVVTITLNAGGTGVLGKLNVDAGII